MKSFLSFTPIKVRPKAPKLSGRNGLEAVLKTQATLAENVKKEIYYSEPIVLKENTGIIFPNTINVIQGKAGSHKSRLTEDICSELIAPSSASNLGFRKFISTSRIYALYVDTERNLKDQYPLALQRIKVKAGYQLKDTVEHFDFISLIEIPREQRFDTLTEYIEEKRAANTGHLVIILDVLTDCVSNFNDPKESMKLIDYMNVLINTQNITFITVIHENPGTGEKARGHLGTEVLNKASTVIQIGFEKGKNGEDSEVIKIKYLKTRNTKKPEQFYAIYSEVSKSLELADSELVRTIEDGRKTVAPIVEVMRLLEDELKTPKYREELLAFLMDKLQCSENTIDARLKDIVDRAVEFQINGWDGPCLLEKVKDGRKSIYRFNFKHNNNEKQSSQTQRPL